MEEQVAVRRQCIVCGQQTVRLVDRDKFRRWQDGEHIQRVWPELSPGQREELMTGTHEECWDKMFSEEE